MRRALLTLLLALFTAAPAVASEPPAETTPAAKPTPAPTAAMTLPGLTLQVPAAWAQTPPKSPMRLAEATLPGDAGPATLVVFQFRGGAGGVEANVERWRGQFEVDGAPPAAETTSRQIGGFKVTEVELRGRFVAPLNPRSRERHNEADWMMLGAIIEGHGDPYYIKITGPQGTLDRWRADWRQALTSLKPVP